MADIPTHSQEPPPVLFVVIQLGGGGVGTRACPGFEGFHRSHAEDKVSGSGNDCSICLEEFKVDEEAREMPCKHVYHSGCVEKWLRTHGSCPVCRFLLPAEEAESGGRGGGLGSFEGKEIGLGFVQSVLALASLASLMGMAGTGRRSEQSGAGQVDDDGSMTQGTDFN